MINKNKFPKYFIWGTATAAHQVEGGNKNSDFWFLENFKNIEELVAYFDDYSLNLSKNTLNSYLKSVINP